jgi:hypothetical protein
MFKVDVSVPQNESIVGVRTTENRGFSPEELAEQCVQIYGTKPVLFQSTSKRLLHIICVKLLAVTAQLCIMHLKTRDTPTWLNS